MFENTKKELFMKVEKDTKQNIFKFNVLDENETKLDTCILDPHYFYFNETIPFKDVIFIIDMTKKLVNIPDLKKMEIDSRLKDLISRSEYTYIVIIEYNDIKNNYLAMYDNNISDFNKIIKINDKDLDYHRGLINKYHDIFNIKKDDLNETE